jgi:hypothetical protein
MQKRVTSMQGVVAKFLELFFGILKWPIASQ